jgi:hypothetical protein
MKQCISYLQTSRTLMIQLAGTSCIIFSLSLVSHETRKTNKNVLSETCGRVWVVKHLSEMIPIKNGFKHGGALLPLFFNCA